MKNFEIPANEIAPLEPFGTYHDGVEFDDDDSSDVFPATFKITKLICESFFRNRGIDMSTVKIFNSEGDSDDEKFPKLGELISAQWGFSEDPPFNAKSEDLYFEYGWSDNYNRMYELTINGKPAILLDVSDGTTGQHFSMIEIILAS